MEGIYRRPTVWEVARMRIRQIDEQMEVLRRERQAALRRLTNPEMRFVMESERLAAEAEKYLPSLNQRR